MDGTVFEQIYATNAWNGTDTRSGPGSSVATTRWIATMLEVMARDPAFGVASVLDVGCGEARWQPALPGYKGVDIAMNAIEAAYDNHPDWDFEPLDVLMADDDKPAPLYDLVLCRDVFQHLSQRSAAELMAWIKPRAGKWMAFTTYANGDNVDIPDGFAYRPDMRFAPFDLGPPVLWIADGFAWDRVERQPSQDTNRFVGVWPVVA